MVSAETVQLAHIDVVSYASLVPRLSYMDTEKEPGAHCLYMHAQFLQDFREFGNFREICCYIGLCKTSLDACH